MYCEFYQLRERPFNVTADPKFLYLNACYREALASLQYGVTQRKGFITLIGEAGTGKTTLLKKVLDELDENTRTVFLFNTNVTFDEILEYVFNEFDLPIHNGKRLYMLQRLNTFLLEELHHGRNVALFVDEAQDLDYSVMEDLRLLSNLETSKEKILQIVLSGQPELGQKLGNPGLRQLRQRVAINCRLQPLARDEVTDYIQARLTAAGAADPKLFSRDAEDRIYEISKGIPRVVNVVCDNALVIGYALGKKRIGGDIVNEAAVDLFPPEVRPLERDETAAAPSPAPAVSRGPLGTPTNGWRGSQIGMIVGVVAAILIGLLSVGRTLWKSDDGVVSRTVAPPAPLEVVAPAQRKGAAEVGVRGGNADVSGNEVRPLVREAPLAPAASDVDPLSDRGTREPQDGRELAALPPVSERRLVDVREALPNATVAARQQATQRANRRREEKEARERERAERIARDREEKLARERERKLERERMEQAAREIEEKLARERLEQARRTEEAAAAQAAAQREREIAQAAERARLQAEADAAAARETDSNRLAAAAQPGAGSVQPAPPVEELAVAVVEKPHVEAPKPEETAASLGEPSAPPGEQIVTARPGDSMSGIAIQKYGAANHTVLDLLKMANPSVRDIDHISAGQQLRVPQLDEGVAVVEQQQGDYAVLVLSTPDQKRANGIEAAMRKRGFHAEVRRTDFGNGRNVYRLLMPGFRDRDAAVSGGKQLQRLFREDEQFASAVR